METPKAVIPFLHIVLLASQPEWTNRKQTEVLGFQSTCWISDFGVSIRVTTGKSTNIACYWFLFLNRASFVGRVGVDGEGAVFKKLHPWSITYPFLAKIKLKVTVAYSLDRK